MPVTDYIQIRKFMHKDISCYQMVTLSWSDGWNLWEIVLFIPHLKVLVTIPGREKQISCINTYMWNLEKWSRWTYLQARNRDTHLKNDIWTPWVEGREGGENWDSSIVIHTLSCAKFHENMGKIKDRNGMDLTEAENIKKRWQGELYKKIFMIQITTRVWPLT